MPWKLYSSNGKARFNCWGTDLLLDMQQGGIGRIEILVDITNIDELTKIEKRGDSLYIGAATPINQIISSSIVMEHAEALSEACKIIGGPQVRNQATLGGNVAHALPAGDGSIALLALDAEVEVEHAIRGRDLRPIKDLFLGPGESGLQVDRECLVGFIYQLEKTASSAFYALCVLKGWRCH
jgi:carbon-monoxide dehydrogenase medium subunit